MLGNMKHVYIGTDMGLGLRITITLEILKSINKYGFADDIIIKTYREE